MSMSKALLIYRDRINTWAARKREGGFSHGGHRWQSRPVDVDNLRDAVAAINEGDPLPFSTWRTADNQDVPADASYVKAIYRAWGEHKAAIYAVSWEAKARLADGVDPDAVVADLDADYDAALSAT
jgi:hypothetical protein